MNLVRDRLFLIYSAVHRRNISILLRFESQNFETFRLQCFILYSSESCMYVCMYVFLFSFYKPDNEHVYKMAQREPKVLLNGCKLPRCFLPNVSL